MKAAPTDLPPGMLQRLRRPELGLMLVAFGNDLSVACVGLGIQQFAIHMLHAGPFMSGLLGTVSSLSYTLGCFFGGSLSDRWGRKKPAIVSCLVCSTVWLLMLTARSPYHLLALVPFSGWGLSLFWPTLQAWLSEFSAGSRQRLNRTMAFFNVSWTAGIMIGPLVAGFIWDTKWWLAFVIPGALTYLCIYGVAKTPTHENVVLPPPEQHSLHPERAQLFLYLAWIGNFASWFMRGTVGSLFPQLAKQLHFSSGLLGVLIFLLSAAQLLMFGITRRDPRWQYNLRALLTAQFVGMAGMALAAIANQPIMFVLAFAAAGLCSGVTYASSLFYALDGIDENRARRSGLHEAVLGSGVVIGPLVGGLLGQHVSLHAPFAGAAVVFGLASVAQLVLWRVSRGRLARRDGTDATAAV